MRRGIWAIAGFAALPFARLIANNPGEPFPVVRFAVYWLLIVILLGNAILIVGRFRPGEVDRFGSALAFSIFAITYLAVVLRDILALPRTFGLDGSVWLAVALVVVAVLVSRWEVVHNLAPVVALLLLLYPVSEVLLAIGSPPAEFAITDAKPLNLVPIETPNVYWLVADGYGRADMLAEEYGETVQDQFLSYLVSRGFQVSDGAVTAYPMTHLSIASTLSMDYVVKEGDDISDLRPLYDMVQGENVVVATLRSWGYSYAMYPGDLFSATQCGGWEDVCLERTLISPADWALLSMTPFASLLEGPTTASTHAELSNPLRILETLDQHQPERPMFVQAHLISPHPPYFLNGPECEIQDVSMDLSADWGSDEEYLGAVRCLNAQLVETIDRLIAADPDAVIILQGDHGPNRGIHFTGGHDVASWTDTQIRVRFSVLSAARLPEGCKVASDLALANTFRIVFSCLSGQPISLLPTRTWTVSANPYEILEIEPPD